LKVLKSKVKSLLTPKGVANLLNISVRTVYDHVRDLGGFYPAGINVLRFNAEVIHGIMEGQNPQGLAVQFPVQERSLRRGRIQNQTRGIVSQGGTEEIIRREREKDPNRYGLFDFGEPIPGVCRKTIRNRNI
jgi:hypothetical protein